MEPGFAFPGAESIRPPKGRKWLIYLLGFSFLSAAVGALFVTVPPMSAGQLTYAGCHSSAKILAGCFSGLYPWLPFVLLFGGAGGAALAVWRWRR